MINGYEDINDNVKHKMAPGWRHGWVIKLKSLAYSIPDNDKDTVKISTWLLILFLR